MGWVWLGPLAVAAAGATAFAVMTAHFRRHTSRLRVARVELEELRARRKG